MTHYHSVETFAETGYATNIDIVTIMDPVPSRWTWDGDGTGAGTLHVYGTEHYVAVIRAIFQQNPLLRKAIHGTATDDR